LRHRLDAGESSWALFHSRELIQFAAQGSAALLSQRSASGLVRAGAPEMGMRHQRIAGFSDVDDGLHWFSSAKAKRPGAVKRPGP
jgi:hypothetical protein